MSNSMSAEHELEALLAAERAAGEPSVADRQRVWEGLEGRVAAPDVRPRGRGRWLRRGLVAVALAGAAGWIGTRPAAQPAAVGTVDAVEPSEPVERDVVIPWQKTPPPAPAVAPLPPQDDAERVPARPRRQRSSGTAARSKPQAVPVPDATSTLAEQLELIASARRALEQDKPRVALEHVEQYRTRFADGVLGEEAEGIATAARCAAGEDGAAARATDERWRSSIHGKLVERFCGRTITPPD